jgi:hypothetical protein
MATKANLRDEHVSAEDIDGDNIRCPRRTCCSTTLVLFGTSQVFRRETQDLGKVTNVTLDEKSHVFDIDRIECLACGTRWNVKAREVVALERQNEELRHLLVRAIAAAPGCTGKAN